MRNWLRFAVVICSIGVVAGSSVLPAFSLLSPFLLALIYIVVLFCDVSLLFLEFRESGEVPQLVATSLSKKVAQVLFEIEAANRAFQDSGSQPSKLKEEVSHLSYEDASQFFESLQELLSKRFRAKGIVILRENESGDPFVFSQVGAGERVGKALLFRFSPFFRDQRVIFGEIDEREVSSIGSLNDFGIAFSVTFPFFERRGEKAFKGAISLLYTEKAPPSRLEVDWLRDLTVQLESEISQGKELKKLEEKVTFIEQDNKAKDDFISHISHDVRQPLQAILAAVSALEDEDTRGSEANLLEILQGVRLNCDQLRDLVNDVLDYSRHNSGKLVAKKETVDIGEVSKRVLQAVSIGVNRERIALSSTVEESVFSEVDKRHFARILTNLLSNAVKYTGEGSVHLEVSSVEKQVLVSVKDTGRGMSEAQLKKLFTPYTRFSKDEEGIGLGLVLSKLLTELSGGTLSVESEPQVGSTFTVSFPKSEAPPILEVESEVLSLRESGKKLVLVVDDDLSAAESLARVLKVSVEEEILVASSVDEAISIIEEERPTHLVCDFNMPQGGGKAVVDYFRERVSGGKVLVQTGDILEEVERKFEGNSISFERKPVEPGKIVSWVGAVGEKRRVS